jgi:hypothetical protein
MEGYVLIAVSQKEHINQPDYRFLAQSPLGEPATRASVNVSRLSTPFERLLLSAAQGASRSRGAVSPDNPQMAAWSWTTVDNSQQSSGVSEP